MNTIQIPQQALNGFLGNILQNVLNPVPDQSVQLSNELYNKEQELQGLKQQNTITMIAAGILAVSTAYLGFKQFKN